MSLGLLQNLWLVTLKVWWRLVQLLSRYLVEYADFYCLVQKGAVVTLAISGVTELILIIFAHYVATLLPLNIFESKLPYSRTSACQMKVILPIMPKIGCHGNVPWVTGKTGPDRSSMNKYLSFGLKIVKISPVDHEIIGLRVIIKKEKRRN